jgi:hypothetical protein
METNLTVVSTNRKGEATAEHYAFKELNVTQDVDNKVVSANGQVHSLQGSYVGGFSYEMHGGANVSVQGSTALLGVTAVVLDLITALENPETPEA